MLCIDLYCGLGGWAEGFLAEDYDVIGFDIERHAYPRTKQRVDGVKRPGLNWSDRTKRGSKHAQFNRPPEIDPSGEWNEYPGQLVLQDVTTLHGSQFKDAHVIVASPPCQAYSYRAMPWKRAKALPPPDNTLFETCFRIQREASEAAGRKIPLVVENVRGAVKWVGPAQGKFGSYYLWGDVPALLPIARKNGVKVPSFQFDGNGSFQTASVRRTNKGNGARFTSRDCGAEGVKQRGSGPEWFDKGIARLSSGSHKRKHAAALIAKIPFPLAQHIARVYK